MEIREKRGILLLAVGLLLAVLCLGQLEFHNELEREVLHPVCLGSLNDNSYQPGEVVLAEDWPQWAAALEKPARWTVTDTDAQGRLAIYGNLTRYENRYEQRHWLTGYLLERKSEYYYRPDGPLWLAPAPQPCQPDIDLTMVRPDSYDYQQFGR